MLGDFEENMLFVGFVVGLFGLPSITDVSRLDSVCGILDVPTFWDCVHRLRQSIHPSVVDVFDVQPLAKPVWLHGEKFEEPTIISKGLDMADAVLQAISLPPVVRTQSIGKLMQAVIAVVAKRRGQICQYRYEQQAIIEQVQMQLSPLNSRLLDLVPLHGRGINSGMNFALLYCIQIACKYSDVYVVDSMLQGFPAMYRVPAGGVFRPVVEPAVERYSAAENNECFDRVVRRLQQTARRASRASSEWSDLVAIWKGVVGEGGEIARGLMDGGPDGRGYSRGQIWSKFAHVPCGPRCLLRFAVWQNGKLRGCDDALFCGHNERTQMEETIVCITSEFPTLVAAEFRKHCEDACRLGTDDVDSAYRRVLCAEPWFTVVAMWDTDSTEGGVRYFTMAGHPFGLRAAVVSFNRVEAFMVYAQRKLGAVPCGQYFDDEVVCEPAFACSSGQKFTWSFHRIVGFPFAEKKHQRMRYANAFLGVVNDAAVFIGFMVVRVKEARRRKILKQLRAIRESGVLSPAVAASVRGKLQFMTTTAFAGVGRAPLQAFARRQYDKSGATAVDGPLQAAIDALLEMIPLLPAKKIPLSASGAGAEQCLYIWSDAMWEPLRDADGEFFVIVDEETGVEFRAARATLAFVVYVPWLKQWYHSYMDVTIEILRLFVPGKKTYIGQLEALAAAAVVYSLKEEWLQGREAYMWIDNIGAKYGLQKGSSSREDTARIINAFVLRVARVEFRPWFEYIPSAQNIADLPSRAKWAEYYEVIGADAQGRRADGSAASVFVPMVLPDFATWAAPVAQLAPSSKRRRGVRGGRGR